MHSIVGEGGWTGKQTQSEAGRGDREVSSPGLSGALLVHQFSSPLVYQFICSLVHQFSSPLVFQSISLLVHLVHYLNSLLVYQSISLVVHRFSKSQVYQFTSFLLKQFNSPLIQKLFPISSSQHTPPFKLWTAQKIPCLPALGILIYASKLRHFERFSQSCWEKLKKRPNLCFLGYFHSAPPILGTFRVFVARFCHQKLL